MTAKALDLRFLNGRLRVYSLRLRMLGSRLRWVTEESRSGNFCVRSKDLPAARYRVAIRVFENSDDAAKMIAGRVITHDFVMSVKTQTVVVPTADDTKEQCGPTPAQSFAACSKNSALETGCGLQDSVAFGWEGGNSLFKDSFILGAPNAMSI